MIATAKSAEVMGSDPIARSTWVMVSVYCAMLENGGTIKDCLGWTSRAWGHICGVTREEIDASPVLLRWSGQDLVVFGYPADEEGKYQAVCKGGSKGGKRRAENLLKQAELDALLNKEEKAPPGARRPLKVKGYADLKDPRNDCVDLASALTGDRSPMGRGYWQKALEVIGPEQFRSQLTTLWGEMEADEKPKNPAAVLTGRIKVLVERRKGAAA